MNDLEYLTLEELKSLNDESLISEYNGYLEELKTNILSKRIIAENYGLSILNIVEKIEEESIKNTSGYYFPQDIILIYPSIREQKSKNTITCDFSGAIISPGSLYINYRPLLDNITTGEKYVLIKTLKVEPEYFYDLPRSISELESLTYKIRGENSGPESINYGHLGKIIGGDFSFQKLRSRRNRNEIRYCK